jgi:YhcN/YlaJ family sporulation lipoprotein
MIRSKTISMSLSAALIVSMIGVTGCGTNNTDNQSLRTKNVKYNTNVANRNNANRYGINSTNNDNGLFTRGDNKMVNLRYSEELSNKISQLERVDMAKVMLTDNNAYVAVTIRSNDTGTGNLNRSNVGTQTSGNYSSGGNIGNNTGVTNGTNGTIGMNGTNRMNGIVGMNGTNATNGGNTTNMNNGDDQNVTQEIKDRIADVIKNNDTNVKNVYVSANPDFVNRVGNYARDVNNGNPISGLGDEFQSLVNRIFPTPSGNMNGNGNGNRTMNNMGR